MTQPDFQAHTKQGDVNKIAALITQGLRAKGIIAKASLKEECLRVILESEQPLVQQELVAWVHEKLNSLGADSIKTLKVYGWQTGVSALAWEQTVELDNQDSFILLKKPEELPSGPEFLTTLKTFKFSSVVPYKQALSPDLYNSNVVRLLIFFSLFPWVVGWLTVDAGLAQVAWILGIYYAFIWGIVLRQLIKPVQFSWSDTLKCTAFTVFVGIPLLLFFQHVPLFRLLYVASDQSGLILNMLGFVLGVGVLEEVCKGLSVYLFLLRPGKLSDPLTAAFYGAMSGLGFAIAEGAEYSVRYSFGLVSGELNFGEFVLVNTLRFISLPLFHAIWAGIVGYFLGLAAINPSREKSIIFIGVAIAAILHGLYNTFSSNLLGLAILVFSILLFVAYLRRSRQLVNEMRQAENDQGKLRLSR
ncbi:MAG: PrsW family glutamic-type intramembrane protease [Pseudanabaenales cyanobacterium]|nr:PrsW family glutamic-type intramembrane protease [Pseudanabaenales cyanobacterium]